MSIADDFLPRYQFSERHEGDVTAPVDRVFDAIATLDDRDDALIRALIWLREAPARVACSLGLSAALKGKPPFGIANFTRLGRCENELVYGLVGRFWRPSFGLETIADAGAFATFDRPGVAKLVMSFLATPNETGGVRLITQTRIFCPDQGSLLVFTPYWIAIRLASGMIRRRMLATIKRRAEAMQTG